MHRYSSKKFVAINLIAIISAFQLHDHRSFRSQQKHLSNSQNRIKWTRSISAVDLSMSIDNNIEDIPHHFIRDNDFSPKRFIGTKQDEKETTSNLMGYFVPGFVAIWAIGYTFLFIAETGSGGLGDTGGIVGVGLVCLLMVSLFSVALFETFKPTAMDK